MISSPESEKFFSSQNNPVTPRVAPSGPVGQFSTSEISPPGSQGVPNNSKHPTMKSEGVGLVPAAFAASKKATDLKGAEGADAKNAPGASWMNKRAEEEYARAMEYVVDREFSLREILSRDILWFEVEVISY